MKNKIKWAILALAFAVTSCITPSKITYLKDMEYGQVYSAKPAPELRVRPEDQLSIQVFSSDPSLAIPFNTGAMTTEGVGTTHGSHSASRA